MDIDEDLTSRDLATRETKALPLPSPPSLAQLRCVSLPGKTCTQDLSFSGSSTRILSRIENGLTGLRGSGDSRAPLALPSLCHAHVHLDKPFLLSYSPTSELCPQSGSFKEALALGARAKPLFTRASLLERGDQLLAESSRAGVTALRGFVEADSTVGLLSVRTSLELKTRWTEYLYLQVCAFAQEPVFSGPEAENRTVLEQAASLKGVEALGSTPYVEETTAAARQNIVWAVRLAIKLQLHLDFHLDYNLDESREPLIWFVLEALKKESWVKRAPSKTVCVGHCTRLALFDPEEWRRLRREVEGLPIFFIGLPTSDIFMMGRPSMGKPSESDTSEEGKLDAGSNSADIDSSDPLKDRPRGTLQVPAMIDAGFKCAISVNNVGNAFTPWGNADPLNLASLGVGIYQTGTPKDAEKLYACVSGMAKEALGLGGVSQDPQNDYIADFRVGDKADLLIFGTMASSDSDTWTHRSFDRERRSIAEVVWDPPQRRTTVFNGRRILLE